MVGYIHRKNEIQTISVVSPDPLSRACKQGKEECRHDSGRKQAGAGGWSNHAWPAGVSGTWRCATGMAQQLTRLSSREYSQSVEWTWSGGGVVSFSGRTSWSSSSVPESALFSSVSSSTISIEASSGLTASGSGYDRAYSSLAMNCC